MSATNVKATLTLDQVDAINMKMDELRIFVTVLVAASTGRNDFDKEGFAYLMEDKFEELFNTYKEATGQERRYKRCATE